MERTAAPVRGPAGRNGTIFGILLAISFAHLLNDTMQSLLPALYPLLKRVFQLSFMQVGLIQLTFQCTASVFQPFVGILTDRRPRPYSLAFGMGCTLVGLVSLAFARQFPLVLAAAALVGVGSSVFHPEASRMAKVASGGRHGFAQSVFQVGGNLGSSLGPLLAAMIVAAGGQERVLWFCLLAVIGIAVLMGVGRWYARRLEELRRAAREGERIWHPHLSPRKIVFSVAILLALIFSKYFYLASLSSYYTFYLIHKFGLGIRSAQMCLFVFLFSVAAGTLIGGPLGDRFGRKYVIWASILGVAPFSLLLPHVDLFWTILLTVPIGVILASAFSAIIVYAQELIPGRTGTVAGLFYGFAFGMGGIGSAALGLLADRAGISFVYEVCGFLPLIGLLTAFLPNLEKLAKTSAPEAARS